MSDEVHIGEGMVLPRELVSGMGRPGCRRCGSAGHFKFANSEQRFLCPCAQGRVMANVEQARRAWADAQKTNTEPPPEVP